MENANDFFKDELANEYDARNARVAPIRDGLNLAIALSIGTFSQSQNLNILSIGTGTGSEIIYLANQFPDFRFTCIEPAAEMVAIMRTKFESAGFMDKCEIFQGYLADYQAKTEFDCALSLLVSHFFVEKQARINFFKEIKPYLKAGAPLINCDISWDKSAKDFEAIFPIWLAMQRKSGFSEEMIEKGIIGGIGRIYAIESSDSIKDTLSQAGFENTMQIYQFLMMKAWVSSRS